MTTEAIQAVRDGQLFIGGAFCDALSGETVENLNPYTEAPICRVAWGGRADVDRAVQAARSAFGTGGDPGPYPALPAKQRARVLFRIADGIEARAEEFALRESLDVGKPIMYTRGFDVPATADLFRYYGGLVEQLEGSARPAGQRSMTYSRREPVGVVGAITPFNFPLNLTANKVAPALAAGNTVVHKPAEQTPLTALLLAEVVAGAGAPAGTYNVVTGEGASVGAGLVEHPDVDKLSFTGSTATGKRLIATAAQSLKKVTVELGGKSGDIIFADADLDAATTAAFQAAFFNTGQFCMSGSRLIVHRSVYSEVLERLTAMAEATVLGDPLDPNTQMGPLAHREQLAKVVEYVGIGQAEGARLVTGGHPGLPGNPAATGFFHELTIFADATAAMRIAQEEIFGPVLTVIAFESDDEAVAIANGTPYGLASGLHTSSLRRAHQVAARLQSGIVWVNTWGRFESSTAFGGYKQSGYGRELGPEGIEEYLQYKTVYVNVD